MRRAGIDCWIVMSRESNEDFVLTYLLDEPAPTGGHRNAYIFFDDGSDRLKRVVIGTYLFRTSRVFDRIIEYRTGPEPFGPSLAPELRKVVEEFKPKRIGVNQSRTIPMCDGLTVEMRRFLEEAIGPVYAGRIVPAEALIVDFLETRLPEERAFFDEAAAITRMLHEEVLSDRVIVPGKTTLLDLSWHMNNRLAELRLPTWFTPIASIKRPDGQTYAADAVVQPGDVVCTDIGIVYAGLATDYQKTAYVLRPGEKEPPQGLQQAFANAVKVQEAVVEVAKPGAIGYQVKEAAEALARSRGLQPSVYSHSVAVGGHDIGAFISADWPDRWGSGPPSPSAPEPTTRSSRPRQPRSRNGAAGPSPWQPRRIRSSATPGSGTSSRARRNSTSSAALRRPAVARTPAASFDIMLGCVRETRSFRPPQKERQSDACQVWILGSLSWIGHPRCWMRVAPKGRDRWGQGHPRPGRRGRGRPVRR